MAEESLEAALESAFTPSPPAQVGGPPRAAPEDTPEEVEDAPLEAESAAEGEEAGEEAQEEQAAAEELAIEIEIDGVPEVVQGNDRIKELVQKGLKAGRGFEENSRVREALAAHVQMAQVQQQFQQAVFGDITQLQALDARLAEYNRVDWQTAFDTDPFNALKLKEQRDQLREQRSAKVGELQAKDQQFNQYRAQQSQALVQAETGALLAKLPEWRNSEKAATEKQQLTAYLANQGYNQTEIGQLTDHRALLVARKAWLYDQLQAGKAGRVKQAREAPPVVRPGAKPSPTQSGKAEYAKFRSTVKQLGTKGNHKAQEDLVLEKLSRAFKV